EVHGEGVRPATPVHSDRPDLACGEGADESAGSGPGVGVADRLGDDDLITYHLNLHRVIASPAGRVFPALHAQLAGALVQRAAVEGPVSLRELDLVAVGVLQDEGVRIGNETACPARVTRVHQIIDAQDRLAVEGDTCPCPGCGRVTRTAAGPTAVRARH